MEPFFVARPGFEPRQTEPKSVVLPLYYQAIFISECKNKEIIFDAKFYSQLDQFFFYLCLFYQEIILFSFLYNNIIA